MFEEGSTVFASSDLVLNTAKGLRVAVRWGCRGQIQECVDDSYKVKWDEPPTNEGKDVLTLVGASFLSREAVAWPHQGQWVQFVRDIRFRSSRLVQSGSIAVVLDARIEDDPEMSIISVRVAPFGSQDAFEMGVFRSDIEPCSRFYATTISPSDLPGGYKAGDRIFATKDIPVKDVVAVGRGDVGIVVGGGKDGREGTLLVRFETQRETAEPLWCTIPPEQISRQPPLSKGRYVRTKITFQFPDGTSVAPGTVGTLVEEANAEAGNGNVVRVDMGEGKQARGFRAPEGTVEVALDYKPLGEAQMAARLLELERWAAANDEAGKSSENVSLLEQNLWALYNFGTGVGLGNLDTDRSIILANAINCCVLKEPKVDGLDGTLGGEKSMRFDHNALINDHSRVDPYAAAIRKASCGKRALDVGTGPYCFLARLALLGGAESVEAVEANEQSCRLAIDHFRQEESGQSIRLPSWALVDVAKIEEREASVEKGDARATINVRVADAAGGSDPVERSLELFHGYSTDTSLAFSGKYDMLVHEILGDFAGTESAATVIADIRSRKLVTADCTFIPRSSATMLAPCGELQLTTEERLIHRIKHKGTMHIKPMVRQILRHFRRKNLLAEPQALEFLDFQNGPELVQKRVLEFRTEREDSFVGLHMHLHVDLDGEEVIDALQLHSDGKKCSWNTTYFRFEEPAQLLAGSRIVCRCETNLEGTIASYSIGVSVGEVGEERQVAALSWQGGC